MSLKRADSILMLDNIEGVTSAPPRTKTKRSDVPECAAAMYVDLTGCRRPEAIPFVWFGMARKRKCRDVLCLLLFLAFWGGMFVVCAIAIDQGDPDRLIFGIDSYGMACGGKHTFGDTTMDLSNNKNLYYLNALDLLAITNIRYAKRMCVDGCPGEENVCGIGDFPCTSNAKFVCPYYWLAEDYIYDKLQNVSSIEETSYWEQLSTMNETIADSTASALIQGMEALDSLPWVGDFLDTYGINSSGPWTGRYYQLRSNIPGQGPCFPVLVQTKAYLN
eukprot:gene19127-25732_t